MKITIIGGGSSYTPELIGGIVRDNAELDVDRIALYDPDASRVSAVAGFCRRMAKSLGQGAINITDGQELGAALTDADFVIFQLRVGGQEARHDDIMMGLKHGVIGQETTGVGGFAKALRTIPVMLEIAETIKELCPQAWVINFTNPSGMVTESLLRHTDLRSVGLCNVPIETHMVLAELLDCAHDDLSMDWVGLNHLGWLRGVTVKGEQRLPELIERIESGEIDLSDMIDVVYPPGFIRSLGAIPSSYMRFFYFPDSELKKLQDAPRSRAQEVLEIEEKLFEYYGDETTEAMPELLKQRGGAWYSRLAVNVIAALQNPEPSIHVVNVAAGECVAGLAANAVVEIPCRLSSAGVEPLPVAEIEADKLGLMQQVKAYEVLAIEAALDRNPATALRALLANPLVPNADQAQALVGELVVRGYLGD